MASESHKVTKLLPKNAIFSPQAITEIDKMSFFSKFERETILSVLCKKLEGNIFLAFFLYQIAVCHVNGDFISP